MVLVDTSVWVDHFRKGMPQLKKLLMNGQAICHPLIIGELACGHLKKRSEVLSLLQALPQAITVDHDEIFYFIEERRLMGRGIGIVDIHLLASAVLTHVPLWTTDKRLQKTTEGLNVFYPYSS